MSVLKTEHVVWSRKWFDSMADGGVWAVPRSGLLFERRGDGLVLTAQMPWDEALLPMTAEELAEHQEDDYRQIREHFAAAGIAVTREETT